MNKTAIKNFAIWARNKLISDINYRAGLLGITADGIHSALPQSTGQTQFYDIGTAEPYAITGEQIHQRQHLVDLLRQKEKESDYKTAYKYVLEEVAYTWFNRLIAVRFMEINDYLPSHIRILSSESGKMEPDLVTTPFDADLEFTRDEQQTILDLKSANKLDEVFRLLFIKQCNALNKILPALFEKTSDYTELLLNLSVIDQDGVVWHLVHDIPESNFNVEEGGQVEIIGWLYQYYNTEPKNEAFAKKGKITKDEVPAVTQLFTPDWIVRYMVENSLGRIYIDKRKNEGVFADGRAIEEMTWHEIEAKRIANEECIANEMGWRYYLPEAEQEPEVAAQLSKIHKEYENLNPKDIKMIDPCMGSGHILVYAFDVLMQIYENAGYGQRDAAKSILENNIYGLDIDDRAFQMAYFAIMMKARQYNRRVLNGESKPNVFSIHESNGINRNQLKYFGKGLNELEKNNAINQITGLLDTFIDAKEYGSILKVDPCDWDLLMRFAENIDVPKQINLDLDGIEETQERLNQIIRQGMVLGQKYEITATNPPYMGASNMSSKLIDYLRHSYPDSKTDLYSVFIERCSSYTIYNGYRAMITQHGWMFLSSFEKLRRIVEKSDIICMAHLGARAFDEISGEVVQTTTFVTQNRALSSYKGVYARLLSATSEEEKKKLFLSGNNRYKSGYGSFDKIPGRPVAYWFNDQFLNVFNNKTLADVAKPRQGLATGDNDRFLRLWQEVNYQGIGFGCRGRDDAEKTGKKWFPCNKGGTYRKWYGNNDYVVNWKNDGFEIKHNFDENGRLKSRPQNIDFYFREGMTWSTIASGDLAMRYSPLGHMFETKGSVCFPNNKSELFYLLGLANTPIVSTIMSVLSPTLDFHEGPLGKVPVIINKKYIENVSSFVETCIRISKEDWDSFETSWDFERHPLLRRGLDRRTEIEKNVNLEMCFHEWSDECINRFNQLKIYEEKINRTFIEIYDLQDELSPHVDDKNVTVHLANLQREVKSLLSYAIGCMFGRYSLVYEGLIFAGGKWDSNSYSSFIPDVDNIIPITDEEYLEDDVVTRFCEWLKEVFGYETLEENLDFIVCPNLSFPLQLQQDRYRQDKRTHVSRCKQIQHWKLFL